MRSRRIVVWGGCLVAISTLTAAAPIAPPRIQSIDGRTLKPFEPSGAASIVFFVATDCPISNSYAPEIQRICREYGPRGVECALMYEDLPALSAPQRGLAITGVKADVETAAAVLDDEVRRHLREYRYADMPAAVDRSRVIAKHAGASMTPQAVVVDRSGTIQYRGRIDNFYAALGVPRQQITEQDLRNALDAVLSGRPVLRRESEAVGCYIVDPAVSRK